MRRGINFNNHCLIYAGTAHLCYFLFLFFSILNQFFIIGQCLIVMYSSSLDRRWGAGGGGGGIEI